MSLVAYDSSDEDSESSDSEDVKDSMVSKKNAVEVSTSGYQKRDDNSETVDKEFSKTELFAVKSKALHLPSPKKCAAQPQSSNIDSTNGGTALSSLLPKPSSVHSESEKEQVNIKRTGVKPSFALDSEDEIIDIEEEYTPLSQLQSKVTENKSDDKAKSVGSLFSLLPAPWQADKTWRKKVNLTDKNLSVEQKPKQPVKISIPSLPQHDSDEEENVDEPSLKKIRTSEGGSGLRSLLPKPKHSVTVKKDNPNRPTVKLASRPLIPHSMTKKQSKGDVKRTPDKAKQNEQAGSDDEDMPVSFFTFDDKSSIAEEDVSQGSKLKDFTSSNIKLKSEALSTESSLKVVDHSLPPNVNHSILPTAVPQDISVQQDHVASPLASEAAPYTTTSGSEGSYVLGAMETRTYFYEQSSEKQQYTGYAGDSYGNLNYGVGSSAAIPQPYYNQDQECYSTCTYPSADVEQNQNVPQDTNIDLEKLHRLQGRKNRHEEINIVDVNADEQIKDSAVLLTKCGTEEVAYRPSRKKSDMPTAQQRRKHQITYLAFQAKEREQELRQQWSANRQTRRQTQSKYGF